MILIIILLLIFISWKIYEMVYYRSRTFLSIKSQIQSYVNNCNELNRHIEYLKDTYLGINQLNYGQAQYRDESHWNYQRPEFKKAKYAPNIYNCSRTVCDNARKQPFKYICKYFNLKANEETLSELEKVLNNFEAAEQGKIALKAEKVKIFNNIKNDISFLIRTFGKNKLEKKLGFEYIDFSTTYFPKFTFMYISSGGNASTRCDIVMDIPNLNRFITYLSEVIKFKKSVAGQRALMTSSLRKNIMRRDNYTCKICGLSTREEPNLLLEIDHIMPVSRGGLTTEANLQTLCWKCNRKKGSKIKTSQDLLTIPSISQSDNESSNLISEERINVTKEKKAMTTHDNVAKVEQNTSVQKKPITEQKQTKKEISKIMYDKEKGIYPAGQYLVGEDIEIGKYLLISRKDKIGSVSIYENYKNYKKDEMITYQSFDEDYHLSLRENSLFVVIENADIQKL